MEKEVTLAITRYREKSAIENTKKVTHLKTLSLQINRFKLRKDNETAELDRDPNGHIINNLLW